MQKIFPHLHTVYLLTIGSSIGVLLALGIFVAPVIFKSHLLLPHLPLSHYDMGIVMTQIFVKANFLLFMTACIIALFELYESRFQAKKSSLSLLFGSLSIIAIFLFTLYYTPYILNTQRLGEEATQTEAFASMHAQSVLTFKLLALSLIGLFVSRLTART